MSKTVPDEWVNGKFGDLARVQNGYAFKSSDFSERGHAAAIRMSNLKKGRIDLSDAKYVPERIVEGLDQFRLSEGDFLFGMSGSLDNYAWVTRDTGICYLNQRVGCLRAKPKSDSLYTAYCYLSETVKREIVGLAAGAAQLNISGSQLEAIPVPIPPLPEQKKIAAILTSVDNVIESTQAQIDKLKDLKTGMMQELLTKGIGHSEFKDSPVGRIPVGWEITNLGSIVIPKGLQTGPFGSQLHAHEYVERGVPVVMPKDMKNNRIDPASIAYIPEARAAQLDKHRVRQGDLLFARRGDIGRFALVEQTNEGLVCGTGCLKARLLPRINPIFISCYLTLTPVIEWLNLNAVGQTMLNLNTSILAELPIILPPAAEQKIIGDAISALDHRINSGQQKLVSLINSKQALMQDLLTGKVRVKVD